MSESRDVRSRTIRKLRSQIRNRVRDEQGATLVLTVFGIVAFLGMVALAVDLGMLLGARTESQRVADAAALAGAGSLITAPNDEDRARQWAIDYAAQNTVRGTIADVRPEDVDVLLDERKVRVRVRNIAARGNAISTIFARVLGRDEVDVGTAAAAQVYPAGFGNCPLPLALPNRWTEDDGDNLWDGPPTDLYVPYPYSGPVPSVGSGLAQCPYDASSTSFGVCDFTGYYDENVNSGDLIEIKTRGGGAGGGSGNSICTEQASWRCWFQPYAIDGGPGGGGANALRPWIDGCPDETLVISSDPPTILYAASGSGNQQSLVQQEFKALVDLNPGQWNFEKACATIDGDDGPCLGSESLRIRFMPLIDPTQVSGSGSNASVPVAGLACVFIDKVAENPGAAHGQGPPGRWNVYMRLTDTCTGLAGGGGGQFLNALRLVE